MPLTGTYFRNLDEKHRLTIPKRLRDQFSEEEQLESLYVVPGMEKSLSLYSKRGFDNLSKKISESSTKRSSYRIYSRLLYSRSEQVSIDNQSRVLVPEWLVQFANLQKDVVLIGVYDHAEIWDKELWDNYLQEHMASFDEIASSALD